MAESVQFWLDNKMSAGLALAAIGTQQLVSYREKYYVVENGAALTKGGKALHYSKSSLPLIWRKALRGETVREEAIRPTDEGLPRPTRPVRKKREPLQVSAAPAPNGQETEGDVTAASAPPKQKNATPKKEGLPRPAPQTTVAAACPYCNQKHELPLEKGKNGKPFFVTCSRCHADFAVRFVTVAVYQAQVAGFR